ncbi:MAG: HAD family phosphatase, partial [Lentisphaerae bacterium]|nr:HAD family phosphatase [Lentisphaerota bacterium]
GQPADEQVIVRIVYGHSWSAIHRDIVALFPALAGIGMAAMADELRPYYLRLREAGSIAIPGSVACLRRLAAAYPIAIVSGSPRQEIGDTLDLIGLADCVSFYIGSEDYSEGKPDPTCYQQAAGRLGVEPRRCVVIEDSRAGVRAAKAAGMKCVALARPFAIPQDVQMADQIVASLDAFSCADVEGLVSP